MRRHHHQLGLLDAAAATPLAVDLPLSLRKALVDDMPLSVRKALVDNLPLSVRKSLSALRRRPEAAAALAATRPPAPAGAAVLLLSSRVRAILLACVRGRRRDQRRCAVRVSSPAGGRARMLWKEGG